MSDRTLTTRGQNIGRAPTANQQPADANLRRTIARMQDFPEWFMDGDDSPWKELCSQGANVTVAGGWGAYERGRAQVAPGYDLSAARLASGDDDYDLAFTAVSYGMASTFRIERSTVRLAAS